MALNKTPFQQDYSHNIEIRPAFPGVVQGDVPVLERTAVNLTGEPLPFGTAVVWDATKGQIAKPSAAGQTFIGFFCRRDLYEYDKVSFGSGADEIIAPAFPAEKKEVAYLEMGELFCYAETDFKKYEAVYFRHTAAGAGKLIVGAVGNAGTIGDRAGKSYFASSGKAGEFALVHVVVEIA